MSNLRRLVSTPPDGQQLPSISKTEGENNPKAHFPIGNAKPGEINETHPLFIIKKHKFITSNGSVKTRKQSETGKRKSRKRKNKNNFRVSDKQVAIDSIVAVKRDDPQPSSGQMVSLGSA